MALPKAVNYFIVVYIVFSIFYTSSYLLGFHSKSFKSNNIPSTSVAQLQERYLGKQVVEWTSPQGKRKKYEIFIDMCSLLFLL